MRASSSGRSPTVNAGEPIVVRLRPSGKVDRKVNKGGTAGDLPSLERGGNFCLTMQYLIVHR